MKLTKKKENEGKENERALYLNSHKLQMYSTDPEFILKEIQEKQFLDCFQLTMRQSQQHHYQSKHSFHVFLLFRVCSYSLQHK